MPNHALLHALPISAATDRSDHDRRRRLHRWRGPSLLGPIVLTSLLIAAVTTPMAAQSGDDTDRVTKRPSALKSAIEESRDRLRSNNDIWEDHSTWETAWRVRSEHYTVRRLGNFRQAKRIADSLERTLQNVEETLGITVPKSALPLHVWVLPNLASYKEFGEEHGQNHSSFYGSFFANEHPENILATYDDSRWGRIWVAHSAVHQILDACYPNNSRPLWLEEGLAAYFSTGGAPDNYRWSKQRFYEIRSDDSKFLPLDELLSDSIGDYGNGNSTLRMVEMGMLFTYLFQVRDDTRTRSADYGPFRDYLRLWLENKDHTQHEMHELLSDDDSLEEFEQEIRSEEFPR